jgi:hypothetical protein
MQSAPNTNVPEIFQSEFLWHADLGSLNGHFWDYQEGYQNGLDYSDHYLDHLVFQGLRLIYDDFHHCLKNIIYHR